MRSRSHTKELIQKTPNLNNSHFLIRLLYKDCYYSHCNNCFSTTTICIIDTVYKVLYVKMACGCQAILLNEDVIMMMVLIEGPEH